jgi:hypothetical protein
VVVIVFDVITSYFKCYSYELLFTFVELQPFETKFGELVEPVKKDSEGAVAGVETEEGLVGQMSS